MISKSKLLTLAVLLIAPSLFAQPQGFVNTQGRVSSPGETILQSYERIFVRSSLSTKVNVLSDAANDEAAAEFYGPFCELALCFVIDNALLFRDDPDMINLTIAAIRGVGDYAYNPAADAVWQVFLRFPDRVIRYEILEILPRLDILNFTGKVNDFLDELNRRFISELSLNETELDIELLLPLIGILGRTGDESSYPILFTSSVIYSGELRDEAINAMYTINGNLFDFCIMVIFENPPDEKLSAFNLALSWEWLTEDEEGRLAETALEVALSVPGDRRSEIQELSEMSLRIIKEAGWIRALPQVLKYYNQSLLYFRNNQTFVQPLINAINCLGSLKSSDAAQALALQLGLYNSRAAELNTEEQEVVLTLINALGDLAYKASYDGLYYASILTYPEKIIEAAEDALAKLKW